ncbi:MAG: phosphotransferase [Eubacterium sp.]|nr:phosphotransferase [Eubacterium sp.]
MIILTKENIVSYIKEHVPSLKLNDPIHVSLIGDGDLGDDVEGDGYCNYVFRVSDGENSYIVKQSTEYLKRRGGPLNPQRNRYEYEIMEMRAKIVPQYVPALYLCDKENNIFVMEDVSNLKLIRFQLNKNHLFPDLAKQGAQYLAATHFYTSEFYLPTDQFRSLLSHFMNADLRVVMENGIFLNIFGADDYDKACGPEFEDYCKSIRFDSDLEFQRYKLRHLFMSKSETLIHGDFHTSNIFADDEHLKVIDMEYTFGAPFSYDLGFIIANLIAQLCSVAFRPFDSEEHRKNYMAYLLSTIEMLYTYYIQFFFEYWDKDSKLEYKITCGYKESLALDILRECFGFAACVNFSRVCGDMDTADFDCIEDNDLRTKAKFASIHIDEVLFRKWNSYQSIKDVIDDIIHVINQRRSF